MKIEKYLATAEFNKNIKQKREMERLKKYPELEKMAEDIAKRISKEINQDTKHIESDMPYKAQYVLERVIEILKEAV